MKSHRPARVAEVIREVAAETILFKLQDPRVKGVTVLRAEVSADLQRAKVYITIMGSAEHKQQCLIGLQRATGFIQKQLGDRLQMRFIPTLTFLIDKGYQNSQVVSRLLKDEGPPPSDLAADADDADAPPDAAGTDVRP